MCICEYVCTSVYCPVGEQKSTQGGVTDMRHRAEGQTVVRNHGQSEADPGAKQKIVAKELGKDESTYKKPRRADKCGSESG